MKEIEEHIDALNSTGAESSRVLTLPQDQFLQEMAGHPIRPELSIPGWGRRKTFIFLTGYLRGQFDLAQEAVRRLHSIVRRMR